MMKSFGLIKKVFWGCFLFVVGAAVFAGNIELVQGSFVLELMEDSGTFSLAYQGSDGKKTEFFASHDEFSSTFFAAKIKNTIYKLGRDSSVKFSIYEENGSAGIKYEIGKDIEIFADFSFCPEFDGATKGAIKVEVSVHNLSVEAKTVSLKGVFDTCLGENSGNHFATARMPFIDKEVGFRSMYNDKWIRSSNGKQALQFLFAGAGITVPQNVSLANKDVIGGVQWFPQAKEGRSFNSVFSYNNSAVSVLWNPMTVSPMTKSSICFYISYSTAGVLPPDSAFLGDKPIHSSLNENDEVVYKDEYGVTYTVGALSDSQLDPKYIEDLLNRIRWLEAEPENVDRNEILQLNAELDAILEKIRRL